MFQTYGMRVRNDFAKQGVYALFFYQKQRKTCAWKFTNHRYLNGENCVIDKSVAVLVFRC